MLKQLLAEVAQVDLEMINAIVSIDLSLSCCHLCKIWNV